MPNPYETPAVATSLPDGHGLSAAEALRVAWQASRRSGWAWLAAVAAMVVVATLALVSCVVPAIVVWPLLGWGCTRFALDALDGEAKAASVFEGFDRIGVAWVGTVGVSVPTLLVMLPGVIASLALGPLAAALPAHDSATHERLVAILPWVGRALRMSWEIIVGSRLAPAQFFVLERGLGPIEALRESYRLTSPVWLEALKISLLVQLLTLAGMAMCCVGLVPATLLLSMILASMFRQLTGRAGSEDAA